VTWWFWLALGFGVVVAAWLVLIVAIVLRRSFRSGGSELVREHWPGPEQSLRIVLRVAGT
jgi:hypothetical protein